MLATLSYTVPGMSCSHCEAAVAGALSSVDGVDAVSVDLGTKRVDVTGRDLADEMLRTAIADCGYEAA